MPCLRPVAFAEGNQSTEEREGMTVELKPCPFCGNVCFEVKSRYAPYIKCKECGTIKIGDTFEECVEKWNGRAKE